MQSKRKEIFNEMVKTSKEMIQRMEDIERLTTLIAACSGPGNDKVLKETLAKRDRLLSENMDGIKKLEELQKNYNEFV